MNIENLKLEPSVQVNLIKRINNYLGKKVKIRLFDGTSIVGRLTELDWTKFVQQVNSSKGHNEFDNLPEACYLRAEHGTLAIPYKDISGIELSI